MSEYDRKERESMANQRAAARQSDQLGPGTAGRTISGAAYRGMEVAAHTGQPSPADPGFPTTRVGLHPGQGRGGTSSYEEAGGLDGQELNAAARLPEQQSAVDMLTSPVEGETPENRR